MVPLCPAHRPCQSPQSQEQADNGGAWGLEAAIPALPLTCCLTLDKGLLFSEPQSFQLSNGYKVGARLVNSLGTFSVLGVHVRCFGGAHRVHRV